MLGIGAYGALTFNKMNIQAANKKQRQPTFGVEEKEPKIKKILTNQGIKEEEDPPLIIKVYEDGTIGVETSDGVTQRIVPTPENPEQRGRDGGRYKDGKKID